MNATNDARGVTLSFSGEGSLTPDMLMIVVTLFVEELGQRRVGRASDTPWFIDKRVRSLITFRLKTIHATIEVSKNEPMLVKKLDNAGLPPVRTTPWPLDENLNALFEGLVSDLFE